MRAVAKQFREQGSDAWFTDSPAELLGPDFSYPPGFRPDKLRKEKDIFDVWFESRQLVARRAAVRRVPEVPGGHVPGRVGPAPRLVPAFAAAEPRRDRAAAVQAGADARVRREAGRHEGQQERQGIRHRDARRSNRTAPTCCGCGAAASITRTTSRRSPQAIKEFGDKYRKIRNTLRYLLSNLYDFNPATDAQEVPPNSLDGLGDAPSWTQLIRDVTAAYDAYQFHRVFRLLHDFCAVQISAVYGNAMKDRLYCEAPTRRCGGGARRSCTGWSWR